MAKKVLPHQTANIDTIVAEYQQKWETDKDTILADKLIILDSHSTSLSSDKSSESLNELSEATSTLKWNLSHTYTQVHVL